jgi:hypothetical protein
VTLQKVAEFTKADPELNRRLRDLQERVAEELAEVGGSRRTVLVNVTGTVVRPGDLVEVAPGLTLELVLAAPRAGADDGRAIEIIKPAAGGTVTVRPSSGTVNGAATQALTSLGLYRYVARRGSYWRSP